METWLMQTQSICIVLLMLVGILFRKRRQLHVRIMSLAIIWDVILILQVELSRSAILKATEVINNSMILNIHVSLAVATVVLYGFMVYTGRKMLADEPGIRAKHKALGYTTFVLRVMTLITSFWAVTPKG